MRNKKVTYMLQAAMIAAIYVVLVIIFDYWSFGPIQFRVAEALTILPFFTLAAIPGLFIGCFLANFLGGAILVDIIFGSIATLLGAVGTYLCSKIKAKWLAPLPPIIANTLIVPFVLKYGYGAEEAVPYMMLTVGIGEVIVCGVLGMMLLFVLEKYKDKIFGN
ncbi:MAG: QueT transporter family protein [Thermoflexaceae bacterium]|nr:QueT transporter family protein [Thermoflexaceae bacterium]